jgi:hypothetical protein
MITYSVVIEGQFYYVDVVPYVGVNGMQRLPTEAVVEAMIAPRIAAARSDMREATILIQNAISAIRVAGGDEQLVDKVWERLSAPIRRKADRETHLKLVPTMARGDYTVSPFCGWSVRYAD